MELTNAQKATRYMAMAAEEVNRRLAAHDYSDERALRHMVKSRWNALDFFDVETEPDACIEVFVRKGKASFIVTNPHTNE